MKGKSSTETQIARRVPRYLACYLLHEGQFTVRERCDKLYITRYRGITMYNMLCRYIVEHVHGDLPHTKYSQELGIFECNQGPNHELISKYQFWLLLYVKTRPYIVNIPLQIIAYKIWQGRRKFEKVQLIHWWNHR